MHPIKNSVFIDSHFHPPPAGVVFVHSRYVHLDAAAGPKAEYAQLLHTGQNLLTVAKAPLVAPLGPPSYGVGRSNEADIQVVNPTCSASESSPLPMRTTRL